MKDSIIAAMDKTPQELAELAEGVAEMITKWGHTTGAMCNSDGLCLLGAGRVYQQVAVEAGGFIPQDYATAKALGYKHPTDVVRHNDGYIPPAHAAAAALCSDESCCASLYPFVIPKMNKDKAIDRAIEQAKIWRNV